MAKISKYIKLDKDILLEYIYNDGNLIGEKYKILIDSRNQSRGYVATDTSGTGNTEINQLFKLDGVSGKYGKVDTTYYSYLQNKDYSSGTPIRHDTIKFHIPTNWTFGEYLGFYVRVYALDSNNRNTYELSNFYFDMTNYSQQTLLNFSSPPLLFQEKLWGKNISIEIPAISEISTQLTNGSPKPNSINYNLTDNVGLSSTSPIFIDFNFISGVQTINGVTTYILGQKVTTTLPQSPEFERLGINVEHSINGDFFEIYGTYNNNISEFKKFIDDSVSIGRRYYVQYNITTYEQNVRGKTTTFTMLDNFNETIDYRPIIRYSTTTAIIDVEMRLIDLVDDSYIIRRASYGMLQNEVSKYSARMTKINISKALKPKIYNIKNNIDQSLLGKTNSMGRTTTPNGRIYNAQSGVGFKVGISTNKGFVQGNAINIPNNGNNGGEVIKVPYPVLIDRFNVIGQSDNALIDNNTYYGNGKMQVQLYPFDNILKFTIATGNAYQPNYLDMSILGDIRISFKNSSDTFDFPLLIESNEIDLKLGLVVFKIPESKFVSIKKIFNSGVNLFYITASNIGITTIVYTGLFQIYDNLSNVSSLNAQANNSNSSINTDPNLPRATAIVTRQLITDNTDPNEKP